MTAKTIKISEENYKWLLTIQSDIQKEAGKQISFDETISILRGKNKPARMSDLSGIWKISDKEAGQLKSYMRKGWSSWKIPSA